MVGHDVLVAEQPWERLDVSSWAVVRVEQGGSTTSLWLEEPGQSTRWLYKTTLIPQNQQEQGEDWSEVIATQVGAKFGVPCAETRLCERDGRRGSVSRSVRPVGYALNEGRVILTREAAPGYIPHAEGQPAEDPNRPAVRRPGHTLENIRVALAEVAPPETFDGPQGFCGFDVFAGYLVLDALIANRDRHEQNWAVLTPDLIGPVERLSPSYDHASSLGYNLSDEARGRYTADPRALLGFAERGTAWRFEHQGRPRTLVGHAVEGLRMCAPEAAQWWQRQLASVDLAPVFGALDEGVTGMSDDAGRFVRALLELNLRRLQDALASNI